MAGRNGDDPRLPLGDHPVERVVGKRGTVTFFRDRRAVVLPSDGDDVGYALLLAPRDDNRDRDLVPATLRLDRAALLDYAAVLLAAAAELPGGDATEPAPHRRAANLSAVVPEEDL